MSEAPHARLRKQVCAERKVGFRQEERRRAFLTDSKETPAGPWEPLHTRHWARKVWGQGDSSRELQPRLEDTHAEGRNQPHAYGPLEAHTRASCWLI